MADPRTDIKARMTRSLFSTRGEDGVQLAADGGWGAAVEQYITHVKITEDSGNPSSPPPPGADISGRKQRYIVVSAQRNGIVRLHKTRENSNGTFSIGKTWGLDGLERLEETDNLGFIITVQKPYYWMTETSKEKYAFVTALIQVYRKFTGGKSPEIMGFDAIFRSSSSQGSQSSRQPPQANPYDTPPPQSNPYAGPTPPPANPYAATSPPPTQAYPYAASPPPSQSNPYAASPPPSQSNPYATTPAPSQSNSYGASGANPYATSAQYDPYATNAGPPTQLKRLPSETADRRPYPPERAPGRQGSRSSPERERNRLRDKSSREGGSNGVPAVPAVAATAAAVVAPLNLTRHTSSSSVPRVTPDPSAYDSSSMRSRRQQDDDSASVNSMGSRGTGRTGGPRPMASAPSLKQSAITSQRALAESPIPARPGSAGRATPPDAGQQKTTTSKHGPKLSISTSTSLPSKLANGAAFAAPTAEIPTARQKSPLRKRPRSTEEAAPSEETISAAMLEIENLLTTFDWTHPTPCATRLEYLLQDELESVQSDNVHALVMNDGPQMQDFVSKIGEGIKQCEELDEMITLYLVELQALSDDVNFIESENRGLHVRTANERALEKELSELLTAMSISPQEFDVLRQESLGENEAIARVERSLLQVYLALKESSGLATQQDEDGPKENMQVVREMRRTTRGESEKFLARLREFVKIKFQAELMSIPTAKSKSKAVFPDHSSSYSYFYRYAGFILFAKEVDPESYSDIQNLYLSPAGRSYKDEFRAFVNQWKSLGRKTTSDELELIFSLARENQSTVSAVRSASIKRAGTVAKTLRSPMLDRADKDREKIEQEGKLPVGEIFAEILSVVIPAFVKEQGFIMEFLQLSPSTKRTYEEFASKGTDKAGWMRDLDKKRPPELDKNASKDVMNAMESLLSWLPDEVSLLVEWCRTMDALQLITILGVLERFLAEWEDSDQGFLVKTLNKQHDKLGGQFHRFVEEQVRSIEDMKVTAKKRQGVLLMFKIFPGFVEKFEIQFDSPLIPVGMDIRDTVNEAYEKLSKAMIDSLQAIAKDTSLHGPTSRDDEDKEQLNSHIMMIENMHYYREAIDDRGNPMLITYKTKARILYDEHLGLYVKAIVRRPLGRLLDFLQGVETFVVSNPSEDVTARISFSKSTFKKVLAHYDAKELRKGIDLLHKRVEKHFGQIPDETDAIYGSRGTAIGRALVQEVWKECQKEYDSIVELCGRIISIYYPEGVTMEFTINDIKDSFLKRG